MSHHGKEYWKALGHLIGFIKVKKTRVIVIRNPKVLKSFIFCYSNYATYKETRKSLIGLVATFGETLLMCLSKTQITVTQNSMDSEYVVLSLCAQEVNFALEYKVNEPLFLSPVESSRKILDTIRTGPINLLLFKNNKTGPDETCPKQGIICMQNVQRFIRKI